VGGAGAGAGTCFGEAVLAAGFGRTATGVTGAFESTVVAGDNVCVGVEWCGAVGIVGA
jgi:hypothetical protein